MAKRLFVLYVVIEMAVIVALTATIGFGWTVLALIGAFVLGIALAGSQLRRQITALQHGMRDPGAGITDGLLVALGSVLTVIPGLVTSVLGLLMLLPPSRAVMRPLATRALGRRVAFVDLPRPRRREYIDGEVVDGEVVNSDVHTVHPDLPAVIYKPE